MSAHDNASMRNPWTDRENAELELGGPRGPKMGAGCGVGRRCQTLL